MNLWYSLTIFLSNFAEDVLLDRFDKQAVWKNKVDVCAANTNWSNGSNRSK
jgi:hypothetical protein